jgi:hypothetical protein
MNVKQFFSVHAELQAVFFRDVCEGYLASFVVVVGVCGVVLELFKQAFMSFTTKSIEFEVLQDKKYQEETDFLCQKQKEMDEQQ